jgi:hypothetical protein
MIILTSVSETLVKKKLKKLYKKLITQNLKKKLYLVLYEIYEGFTI